MLEFQLAEEATDRSRHPLPPKRQPEIQHLPSGA